MPLMAGGIRTLFLTHRYLGVALCLLFLIWFISGIAMLYVRMPILYPAERFNLLEPIPLDQVMVSPQTAARAIDSSTARRIRMGTLEGRPAYHVLVADQPWRTVYADTGASVRGIDPAAAERITARITGARSPRFMETVETIDQWTLTNSLNQHRPLHRVALDNEAGTEVYVSAWTGEIVMRTTARERALAWIGPIVHWGAPEVLRTRVAAWRQIMIWLSTAGVGLAISGIWIGIRRYRRRGYRFADGSVARVPYRGLKMWHHWAGLAFGLVTLTWIVSGLLYLNPGGSRARPLDTTTTMSPYSVGGIRSSTSTLPGQSEAFAGGRFDPAQVSIIPSDAWARVGRSEAIREVEMGVFGGRPYYTFFADPVTSWTIAADRANAVPHTRFDTDALIDAAARAVPHATIREATLLGGYDAYWYSVGAVAPKRTPVLRVKFDDEAATWFYIDPHTGTILRRYDTYGRVMRWAINGLHTLDFPFLMFNRPAWDLTIILLSLGGIALSGSGLWMGWRRWPGKARRPATAPGRLAWGHRTTMIVILAVLTLLIGAATFAQAQETAPPGTTAAQQSDAAQSNSPLTLREEVVVTGSASREPVSSLATTVQVIDEATIERSTATTVTELLADLGVAFLGKWTPAQASVNLRGGQNDPQGRDFRSQVVVLINGRRAGTSNLSKLSVTDLRRVEVLRGASSLLYGSQAIGGVINLIMKDGLTSPGTEVEFTGGSFGLVNGSAAWGASFGRVDVRLTAQAARSGDYKSGGDSPLPMTNTAWNQRGAGISLGFTRSPRERVSVQVRSDGMYDVGFRGSAWDTDNFENRDNQSLDVAYQRTGVNDRWNLSLSGYTFRDTDDFHWGSEIVRNAQNRPAPGFDTDDNERTNDGRGLKGTLAMQPGRGNTFWVGTDADWMRLRSTRVRTPAPGGATTQIAPFDNNNDTRNMGLFAETAQRFVGERLVLRGGLRHDWAHLAMKETPNFPTLAPRSETTAATTYRGGVVVQLVPQAHVRFGIGSGFRTPTATELAADFVAPQGGQQVGNPDLEPEKSRNMEVGVLADLGRASADIVFFHTDIDDRIALTPIDGNRSIWSNRGTSDISGLEVQTRVDLFGVELTRFWTAVNGVYHFTMRDNEAERLGLLSDRIQRMYEYQASLRIGVDAPRWTAQLLGALHGPMWYDTEESLLVPFAESVRTWVHRKDPFWLWTISGDYALGRGLRLRAAVNNLLNKNVHPTFIAENKEPFLSDPEFALGGRGNSLPGRAFTVGLALRIP
jgi:vitamin B12 transporter